MTVPDDLVEAAAEALHTLNGCPCGRWPCAEPRYAADALREAGIALAAAFAALPECEEAREPCGRCKGKGTESWQKSRNPADGREEWPCVRCEGRGWNIPPTVYALAKWGQP